MNDDTGKENDTETNATNIELSNEIRFEISPEIHENEMKKRSAVSKAAGIVVGTAIKGAKIACCIGLGMMIAGRKMKDDQKN
ncbi:MAG: hypothetical protein FWD37_04355 [Methanomassiliicoccaceae archaeon]|nr:hypothetical protein [Methanomassiliicoccaceae archaeon]